MNQERADEEANRFIDTFLYSIAFPTKLHPKIAQYEGRSGALNPDWSRVAIVQPSNRLLSDSDNQVVTLWRVDDRDGLITRACDRLHWFLTYSRTVSDSDRAMCDIQSQEATGRQRRD